MLLSVAIILDVACGEGHVALVGINLTITTLTCKRLLNLVEENKQVKKG